MKYLKVNFNRYQRKLSRKIRPLFLVGDETELMYFIYFVSIFSLTYSVLELFNV